MVLVLIISLAIGGWATFYNVFTMLRGLHLGVITFFIFIVGQYSRVEKYMRYKLGILSVGAIFLVVFNQVENIYIALTINSLVLTGLFYFVYKIFQFTPQSTEKKREISVRRVLAGERMTTPRNYFHSKYMEAFYNFLTAMPGRTKSVLELFNVILILILIVYYITHV